MTVSSDVSKIISVFSAAVTGYPFPFKIFHETELMVEYVGADETVTTLALGLDYTIAPGGIGVDAGGKIVLTPAAVSRLAAGGNLVMTRSMQFVQETNYSAHDVFPAETHERALDILTMMCQELREIMGRALVAPPDVENPIPYSELEDLRAEMVAAIAEARELLESIINDTENMFGEMIDNAKQDLLNTINEVQDVADELFFFLTQGRPNFRGDWKAGESYLPNDLVRGPDGLFWIFTVSWTASDFLAETADKTLIAYGAEIGANENNHQAAWLAKEAVVSGGILTLPITYKAGRQSTLLFHNNTACYPAGIDEEEFQYEETGADSGGLSSELLIHFNVAIGDHLFFMDVASAFSSAISRIEGIEDDLTTLKGEVAEDAAAAEASRIAADAAAANAQDRALAAGDSAILAANSEAAALSYSKDAEAAEDGAANEALKSAASATAANSSAQAAAQSASQAALSAGQAAASATAADTSAQAALLSANNAANSAGNSASEADEAAAQAAAAEAAKQVILDLINNGIPADKIVGVLDAANIPDSAKDTIIVVASEADKILLTIDQVQNGDVIEVLQDDGTVLRYLVIDDTQLSADGVAPGSEAAFKEMSTGTVRWEDIQNKPSLALAAHAASHATGGTDAITPGSIGAAPNQSTLSEQAPSNANLTLTNTGVGTKFQQARNLFAYLLSYIDQVTGLFPVEKGGTGKATAQEAALALFPEALGESVNRLAGVNEDGSLSGTVSLVSLANVLSAAGLTVDWADIQNPPDSFTPSAHAASHGAGGADPVVFPPTDNNRSVTVITADLAAGANLTVPSFVVGSNTLDIYLDGLKCFNGTDAKYHQYMEVGTVGEVASAIQFNFALTTGQAIDAAAPKI